MDLEEAEKVVDRLYKEVFQRCADPGGKTRYSFLLVTGRLTEGLLREVLLDSEEYKQRNIVPNII